MMLKRVAGAGSSDILIEAQLVKSTGLAVVLNVSGRKYIKALFSIKCISEEIFKKFLKDGSDESMAQTVFSYTINDLI